MSFSCCEAKCNGMISFMDFISCYSCCLMPIEQLPSLIALLTHAWPPLIIPNCLPIKSIGGLSTYLYFKFFAQIDITINLFIKRYPKMILNMLTLSLMHPPHIYPVKFGYVLLYSPYLFGNKLFSMQDKLVNNKHTHFLKQNFSETITPIDKSCVVV